MARLHATVQRWRDGYRAVVWQADVQGARPNQALAMSSALHASMGWAYAEQEPLLAAVAAGWVKPDPPPARATLKLGRPMLPHRDWDPSQTAASHNEMRAFRALCVRGMRQDIQWRTPSGVPFAWIGRNPPRTGRAGD